jgi:hypothetical protein
MNKAEFLAKVEAASENNLKFVELVSKLLTELQLNPKETTAKKSNNLLIQAVFDDDFSRFEQLLPTNPELINKKDEKGRLPATVLSPEHTCYMILLLRAGLKVDHNKIRETVSNLSPTAEEIVLLIEALFQTKTENLLESDPDSEDFSILERLLINAKEDDEEEYYDRVIPSLAKFLENHEEMKNFSPFGESSDDHDETKTLYAAIIARKMK